MSYPINAWTAEQLERMNQQGFMIDFLDTFKISPEISQHDLLVTSIKTALSRVESQLEKH